MTQLTDRESEHREAREAPRCPLGAAPQVHPSGCFSFVLFFFYLSGKENYGCVNLLDVPSLDCCCCQHTACWLNGENI